MKEIFILLATSLPLETIVDELNIAIQKYILSQTKERKMEINMWCNIFLLKEISNKMDPIEMINQMDQVQRIKERLETQNQ